MSGLVGTQPWASIIYFKKDAPAGDWSVSLITALANAANSQYGTQLKSHAGSNVTMNHVKAVDIGSGTPNIWENTTPQAGTGAGNKAGNAATCSMINYFIPARYKGGHPRGYWPLGIVTDAPNEFQWSTTYKTAIDQAFANFIGGIATAVNSAGATNAHHCVPAYNYVIVDDQVNHKYKRKRDTLKTVYNVTAYSLNLTQGTQRRRLIL